jgi:hypothetical protein
MKVGELYIRFRPERRRSTRGSNDVSGLTKHFQSIAGKSCKALGSQNLHSKT